MNTKIIDKRTKVADTKFIDLQVGDFFQDEQVGYYYQDSICMKVSEVSALRFLSEGEVSEEDWSTIKYTEIFPLKAIITVEQGG